jgi:hypothetical protein
VTGSELSYESRPHPVHVIVTLLEASSLTDGRARRWYG